MSAFHIYRPIWVTLCARELHVMVFGIRGLCENWHKEGQNVIIRMMKSHEKANTMKT
jgi:hypothetical protein